MPNDLISRSALLSKAIRVTETDEGGWEHPSWSRDARHLTVNKSGAIFIVDTLKDGDKPRRVFSASGNFISPVWQR